MRLNTIFTKRNRSLLLELARTDFKLRYQGSLLGYLWSFAKPLLMFGILYAIFTRFLRFGAEIPNFAYSLLLAIVLWNFFVEATSTSLRSIVDRGEIIRKIAFPHYIIVVSSVTAATINLILNLFVVLLFAYIGPVEFSWQVLWFPLILVELIIATLSIAFILGAAYVRFRDIAYIWEVVLQAMFFAVPIIYPLALIPSELAKQMVVINPIAQIIQDAKAVLIYDDNHQIYDIVQSAWLLPFILVGLSAIIATLYFRRCAPNFAENV